jgi:carbonic anhydrase
MQVIYRDREPGEPEVRHPHDEEEALAWLEAGNRQFAQIAASQRKPSGKPAEPFIIDADFGVSAVYGRAPEPRPFGVVLTCADARVPVELIFNRAVNDLFVVRLVGNTAGDDAVASVEYAARHFPTIRSIVVLGHTMCGAVATAVDLFLEPKGYLDLATDLPMRSLVDRMQVSVRVASMALDAEYGPAVWQAPGYAWAMLEVAVYINSAYVAYGLRAGLAATGKPHGVVYGVYDVNTCRVSAGPQSASAFTAPPEDPDAFRLLSRALAKSPRVRDVLLAQRPLIRPPAGSPVGSSEV